MRIKSEIIKLLLEKDLTTVEIAEMLGYGERKNKYDVVDRPLKELVNEGLIEKSRVKAGRGRPATLYSFKRDMSTILKAYENFPDVRDSLRESDWVRKLVAERIGLNALNGLNGSETQISETPDKNSVEEMLKLSPSFFELAIKVESIGRLANLWYAHIKNPFIMELVAEEHGKHAKPMPDALRLLFSLCVFLDEVENKAHPDAFELLKKFASESLQLSFEMQTEMLKDAVSSELMLDLKRIAGLIRAGDASFQQLLWLVNEYERVEAMLSELKGGERDRLIKLLDEIYNRIALFLDLSILK